MQTLHQPSKHPHLSSTYPGIHYSTPTHPKCPLPPGRHYINQTSIHTYLLQSTPLSPQHTQSSTILHLPPPPLPPSSPYTPADTSTNPASRSTLQPTSLTLEHTRSPTILHLFIPTSPSASGRQNISMPSHPLFCSYPPQPHLSHQVKHVIQTIKHPHQPFSLHPRNLNTPAP